MCDACQFYAHLIISVRFIYCMSGVHEYMNLFFLYSFTAFFHFTINVRIFYAFFFLFFCVQKKPQIYIHLFLLLNLFSWCSVEFCIEWALCTHSYGHLKEKALQQFQRWAYCDLCISHLLLGGWLLMRSNVHMIAFRTWQKKEKEKYGKWMAAAKQTRFG